MSQNTIDYSGICHDNTMGHSEICHENTIGHSEICHKIQRCFQKYVQECKYQTKKYAKNMNRIQKYIYGKIKLPRLRAVHGTEFSSCVIMREIIQILSSHRKNFTHKIHGYKSNVVTHNRRDTRDLRYVGEHVPRFGNYSRPNSQCFNIVIMQFNECL